MLSKFEGEIEFGKEGELPVGPAIVATGRTVELFNATGTLILTISATLLVRIIDRFNKTVALVGKTIYPGKIFLN